MKVVIMRKRNDFVKLFESRKSNIDSRIRRDYIENGIATINCCISGYHDVISTYSSKGQERLNFDSVNYLEGSAEPIPDEYPLVLNIIGDCLSDEEKNTIEETIYEVLTFPTNATIQSVSLGVSVSIITSCEKSLYRHSGTRLYRKNILVRQNINAGNSCRG